MIGHDEKHLDELFEAARIDALNDDQFEQLNGLMLDDPGVCRAYSEYMTLHAMLLWECSNRPAVMEDELPAVEPIVPQAAASGPSRFKWAAPLALAAAVLLVASVGIGVFISMMRPETDSNRGAYAQRESVGVVLGGDSTAWQASNPNAMLTPGESVHIGQVAMESGQTEIELFSGVRLSFTGPVQANMQDDMRLALTRGKVRATVPAGSAGFTIEAAGVQVIDLGTVFEVEVTDGGLVDVNVFEGKVQTVMNAADGEAHMMRLAAKSRIRLDPARGMLSHFNASTQTFDPPLSIDWQPIDKRGHVQFADGAMRPYANQDGFGGQPTETKVLDDGQSLHLKHNAWKRVDFDYEVTSRTVIKLEFKAVSPGEMSGVALDEDNAIGPGRRLFMLAGRDVNHKALITDYRLDQADEWTTCRIPIGKHYRGSMKMMAFFADDDARGKADAQFRNVRVFELENE